MEKILLQAHTRSGHPRGGDGGRGLSNEKGQGCLSYLLRMKKS